MIKDSLRVFTDAVRSAWGPLTSELVASCAEQVACLLDAPATEAWLTSLHADAPGSRELYRDPAHDFLLLAHTEVPGLYRPPHDHGRGWVFRLTSRDFKKEEVTRYLEPRGAASRAPGLAVS